MEGLPILGDLLVVLSVSLVVVAVCHLLRLPTLVGFLIAGVLVGPGGLGLIGDLPAIEAVAEIGVIFLLFTVGLEFSLRELARLKRLVVGGGAAQLGLTAALAALGLRAVGLEWGLAIFFGCLISLSSTAVIIKILVDRGETHAVHGRSQLAISIFQDLATVPLILLTPFLAGAPLAAPEVLAVGLRAAAVIAGILLVATYVFPFVLERVVRTGSRELFTLVVLGTALGTAYLTALAGLSLALGAFLAGMVISESEYAHQILAETRPVRDAFSGLFFVSIGLLMSPGVVLEEPLLVGVLVVGTVALKAAVAGAVILAFGLGVRAAVLAGLGLAQVGEFSFILAGVGVAEGLLGDRERNLFLVTSVSTMLAAPLLIPLAHRVLRAGAKSATPAWWPRTTAQKREAAATPPRDHVVIVGFGVNGRNVARALRLLGVSYRVVDLNPETVRRERRAGEPIIYGDATRRAVLEKLGVAEARAVVATVPDPAAARQVVAQARALSREALLIVRTRHLDEVDPLHELGADEVVPEEFETSLELAGRVMATYGASAHVIEREKARLRRERYELLRAQGAPEGPPPTPLSSLLAGVEVEEVAIGGGPAPGGSTLRELGLRARTGALIVAVARGDDLLPNPDPDLVVRCGDRLVVVGRSDQLCEVRRLLAPDGSAADEAGADEARPGAPR